MELGLHLHGRLLAGISLDFCLEPTKMKGMGTYARVLKSINRNNVAHSLSTSGTCNIQYVHGTFGQGQQTKLLLAGV